MLPTPNIVWYDYCNFHNVIPRCYYRACMKLSFFSFFWTRFLSSSVSEFQTQEEHWLLHPADLHALDPNHHPVLGVLLDQLRCFCCPCGFRWDIWSCDVCYCWWRCLLGLWWPFYTVSLFCMLWGQLWWFFGFPVLVLQALFCLPLIVE